MTQNSVKRVKEGLEGPPLSVNAPTQSLLTAQSETQVSRP